MHMLQLPIRISIARLVAVPTLFALAIFPLSAAEDNSGKSSENLWEISKQHLKDPFKWPSVWRQTPQAGNASEMLGIGDAPPPKRAAGEPRDKVQTKARMDWRANEEKRTRSYMQRVGPLQPKPLKPMEEYNPAGAGSKGPVRHYMTQAVALATPFIKEPSGGRIFERECDMRTRQANESEVLQLFDEVLLSVGRESGVKPGDLFRTFEIGPYHQSFAVGRPLGRIVETNGVVEVTQVGKKTSTARLLKCYGTISKRSRAAPLEPFQEVAATRYAPLEDGRLSAQVVWVTQDQQLPQPFSYAILDQGARKGFKAGDMVLFFNRYDRKMTDKVLGDGLVVNVQEESCTILIQDLFPGIVNRGDFVVAVQTPVL